MPIRNTVFNIGALNGQITTIELPVAASLRANSELVKPAARSLDSINMEPFNIRITESESAVVGDNQKLIEYVIELANGAIYKVRAVVDSL